MSCGMMINFYWRRNRSGFLTIGKPFPSIDAHSIIDEHHRGSLPSLKAEYLGRDEQIHVEVQLCCAERHAEVLRNAMQAEPDKMSDFETELTTDVTVSLTNLHI